MKTTKKIVFITAFFFSSFLGHAQESPFFLSSEKIVQRKQASLNGCLSFVFFPLLKLEEKDAADIIQFIEQELRKAGIIMKGLY